MGQTQEDQAVFDGRWDIAGDGTVTIRVDERIDLGRRCHKASGPPDSLCIHLLGGSTGDAGAHRQPLEWKGICRLNATPREKGPGIFMRYDFCATPPSSLQRLVEGDDRRIDWLLKGRANGVKGGICQPEFGPWRWIEGADPKGPQNWTA